MTLLDWSLITSYIIALAVVALPVEVFFSSLLYSLRRRINGFLDSPEKRAELVHEVVAQIWEPLNQPERREAMITEVAKKLWEPLSTPDSRQKLIAEVGHGVIRAFREQMGSLKGAAVRSEKAGLLESALEGGSALGVLGALPGKIELPIVGKVTPAQALQLFQSLRGLLGGGGLQQLTAGSQSSSGSASNLP